MLSLKSFKNLEVIKTISDETTVIIFKENASINLFVKLGMPNTLPIEKLIHKKLLSIASKNEVVIFKFDQNLELKVDISDSNLNGPEVFLFKKNDEEILVRTDDLEDFVEKINS